MTVPKKRSREDANRLMKLIHTLLFLLRTDPEQLVLDLQMAGHCLQSLERSESTKLVVYNQGFWSNHELEAYLKQFALDCVVIGGGENVGTVKGRQGCFSCIFEQFPDTQWISEIHLDMVFPDRWEVPLVQYLDEEDQPLVSCGIVDAGGNLPFLGEQAPPPPHELGAMRDYLTTLTRKQIVPGFTNPCIHKAEVLRQVGGYDPQFLTGMQAFEDDSMLLGYYYYYGVRRNWRPQVNFNAVVYHQIAGQRSGLLDNHFINYQGLVQQHGAMGLKRLSQLHQSPWQIRFFSDQYHQMVSSN